jgi:hypothetical protein
VKGCLLRLALYLPILALCIVLFSIRAPFPTLVFNPEADGMALAPVAAFFFWFAILYLLDTRRAQTDLDTARAALGRGLRDGESAVVYGTVEERGPLLEAPFTGESCVGYQYVVQHNAGGRMGTVTDYEGCALAPFVIQGPLGALAVLAPPGKEIFYEIPFQTLKGDDAYAHAERYLQATDFGQPGGLFGDVSRRESTNGPGCFKQDQKNGTQPEVRSCTLTQRVLRPRDEVHVAGVYSEAKQAIEPDPDGIMKPLHVVPGGEASLARKIRSKLRGAVVSAALGLVVIAIHVFAFLLRTP